jgi:hypothetical protein
MAAVQLSRYEAEEGKLPPYCMRCGAPSVVFKQKRLFWIPPWFWLFFFFGILPWVLVRLVATKRMRVSIPLCERHKNHWKARSWFASGGLVLLVLLAVALAILEAHNVLDPRMLGMGLATIFVLGILWLISICILDDTSIRPAEITNDSITLKRVSNAFIEPLRARRLTNPILRPEVHRTSNPPFLGIVVVTSLVIVVCIGAITTLGRNERFRSDPHTAQPQTVSAAEPPADANAESEKKYASQFMKQHSSWLYEHDSNGNIIRYPRTGGFLLTPNGNLFVKYLAEAEAKGIRKCEDKANYALRKLAADGIQVPQQ